MKEAMPEGGEAMLFVGSMDNANARERVQSIKSALEGSNIAIVDVRNDEIEFVKARRNVEDTLTDYRDIDMLFGLYRCGAGIAGAGAASTAIPASPARRGRAQISYTGKGLNARC